MHLNAPSKSPPKKENFSYENECRRSASSIAAHGNGHGSDPPCCFFFAHLLFLPNCRCKLQHGTPTNSPCCKLQHGTPSNSNMGVMIYLYSFLHPCIGVAILQFAGVDARLLLKSMLQTPEDTHLQATVTSLRSVCACLCIVCLWEVVSIWMRVFLKKNAKVF